MADLRFGAWAQSAIGAAIRDEDDGRAALGGADFQPKARVRRPDGTTTDVARRKALQMLGPGGIAALDQRVVGRVFPAPGTGDARSNDMAAVELAISELPWLFTPARASTQRRLRPWLVLVVVDVTTPFDPAARPLPVLHANTRELPDLHESWAWAHVQLPPTGDHGISRLLCPRRLEQNSRYRACVVPAFKSGVAAGRGATGPDTQDNGPAWEVGSPHEVVLPVYHAWEFGTGPEGDFEDVVRRLRPAGESSGLGAQEVDIAEPWPTGKPLVGTTGPAKLAVQGAMGPVVAPGEPPSADPSLREALTDFRKRASRELSIPADRLAGAHDPADDTGAVAPPIYGGRHAGIDHLTFISGPTVAAPGWVSDLNLSPANRLAAGLGAEYVRTHQEDLMARAWEQVGAIREANRRRAMAELATNVLETVHRRHVQTLSPGELVAMAAPAAPRTRTGAPNLAMEIVVSPLPDGAASSSFARFMRPFGHVARSSNTGIDSVVTRGLRGEATVPDPRPLLSEALDPTAETDSTAPAAARRFVMLDAVRQVAEANELERAAGMLAAQLDAIEGVDAGAMGSVDVQTLVQTLSPQIDLVRDAVAAVAETDFTDAASDDERLVTPIGVQIAADRLARRLTAALEAGDRIERRLSTRIAAPGAGPGLAPLMAYPKFPLPMALALLHTAPEWFLPGLGAFPADRAALLATNDAFIESYLVGLNHEMMSELLWREYPTDRRGSPFRSFWPRPGVDGDVPSLDTWRPHSLLGGHSELSGNSIAILLVRGDVVRRFPDMIVTAVRALAPAGGSGRPKLSTSAGDVRTALFVLPIDPSTAAYAFAVPPGELLPTGEDAGWFFVFQEHDYRMRFGFDLSNDSFGSWDDLDWDQVDLAPPAQVDLGGRGFASVAAPLGPPAKNPQGLRWGERETDATHVARIALQKPVRVAMHANLLVRPAGG